MFNVQYLGEHLIDVNPRVYGSVVVTAHAGINFPDLVARLTAGEEVGGREPVRAPLGVRYRWIEGDVRSLLDARRAKVTRVARRGPRAPPGARHRTRRLRVDRSRAAAGPRCLRRAVPANEVAS